MSGPASCGRGRTWLAIEAATAGLGYAGVLCWTGVCLVASFKPWDLGLPYWQGVPGLRTDTCGFISFVIAVLCLCLSEYLRLRRKWQFASAPLGSVPPGSTELFALALSRTVGALATGIVLYLSVNAVTHPVTLNMPASHIMPWPTEGTLRVISLLLCAASVMVYRSIGSRCVTSGGEWVKAKRGVSGLSVG